MVTLNSLLLASEALFNGLLLQGCLRTSELHLGLGMDGKIPLQELPELDSPFKLSNTSLKTPATPR